MKNCPFVSSFALVAVFGTQAACEVAAKGYAELGLVGGSDLRAQLHHDFDIAFHLRGETDHGLVFGATIDLDEITFGTDPRSGASVSSAGSEQNRSSVYLETGFGRLTLGETDGAMDHALSEVGYGSALADEHTEHAGFNGNAGLDGYHDGQIVRVDTRFDQLSLSVSAEMEDRSQGGAVLSAGVTWSQRFDLGEWNVGLGIQNASGGAGRLFGGIVLQDPQVIGSSLTYHRTLHQTGTEVGIFANISLAEGATQKVLHQAMGVYFRQNAILLAANAGKYSKSANSLGAGVTLNYDLGGGATWAATWAYSNIAGDSVRAYSTGLILAF